MVRSQQGMRLNADTAGSYWEPRYSWGTWSTYNSRAAAEADRAAIQAGQRPGERVAVILEGEEQYAAFCRSHWIV
jgi:acyl-CoA synthetase (AMP-forming)/AMP-acid ligase II